MFRKAWLSLCDCYLNICPGALRYSRRSNFRVLLLPRGPLSPGSCSSRQLRARGKTVFSTRGRHCGSSDRGNSRSRVWEALSEARSGRSERGHRLPQLLGRLWCRKDCQLCQLLVHPYQRVLARISTSLRGQLWSWFVAENGWRLAKDINIDG